MRLALTALSHTLTIFFLMLMMMMMMLIRIMIIIVCVMILITVLAIAKILIISEMVLGVEPPREIGVSLCQSYSPTQALMYSQEMMMIKH